MFWPLPSGGGAGAVAAAVAVDAREPVAGAPRAVAALVLHAAAAVPEAQGAQGNGHPDDEATDHHRTVSSPSSSLLDSIVGWSPHAACMQNSRPLFARSAAPWRASSDRGQPVRAIAVAARITPNRRSRSFIFSSPNSPCAQFSGMRWNPNAVIAAGVHRTIIHYYIIIITNFTHVHDKSS